MHISELSAYLEDERCRENFAQLVSKHQAEPEEWRFVVTPSFVSTDYTVSDLGRVLSLPRYRSYSRGKRSSVRHRKFQPGGLMSPGRQPSGHMTIRLMENKKPFETHVHRLVAWAFIGPQPPEHYVRHLDGNPSNNQLKNLAYVTPWENITDTFGRAGATGIGVVIGSSLERRLRATLNQLADNSEAVEVIQAIVDLLDRSREMFNSK